MSLQLCDDITSQFRLSWTPLKSRWIALDIVNRLQCISYLVLDVCKVYWALTQDEWHS